MFKASKKVAYTVLKDLGRLDVDMEFGATEIGKAVELCLKTLATEEAAKRQCSQAILVLHPSKDHPPMMEFLAYVGYKVLESLGLKGTLAKNWKTLALLGLELGAWVRRKPDEAKEAGLEFDRDGNLYLLSTPPVVEAESGSQVDTQ